MEGLGYKKSWMDRVPGRLTQNTFLSKKSLFKGPPPSAHAGLYLFIRNKSRFLCLVYSIEAHIVAHNIAFKVLIKYYLHLFIDDSVGWDSFHLGGCTNWWIENVSYPEDNLIQGEKKIWIGVSLAEGSKCELLDSSWLFSWSPNSLQMLLWCYCWSTGSCSCSCDLCSR